MVLHRDFMMRMIRKLSQAFFRIVAGKSVEDPEQSILEIEDLISEALGTPREFVLGQGPAAIETLPASLAAEVGRLLMLHGNLSEELGDEAKALRARRMGFHSLRRAMERPDADFATMASEQFREAIDAISSVTPADPLAEACMLGHQVARADERWDDAEDWLFWALEVKPGEEQLTAGREFFEFLRTLDEEALEEGGLAADDIDDAIRELETYG